MANTPAQQQGKSLSERDPVAALRQRVDRIFDEFPFGFGRSLLPTWPSRGISTSFTLKAPDVNIAETKDAFEITAELPGMDEKDVEVSVADGVLTIKGEKKEEKESKDKNYHLVERNYGSFQRSFGLPENANEEKIKADFSKGVLRVEIAKKEPSEPRPSARKIEIKSR